MTYTKHTLKIKIFFDMLKANLPLQNVAHYCVFHRIYKKKSSKEQKFHRQKSVKMIYVVLLTIDKTIKFLNVLFHKCQLKYLCLILSVTEHKF